MPSSISPILLIVFNRPDTTQIIFDVLKMAKPSILFIAADGPRNHKKGETDLCHKTRAIFDQIDWPCEVKTLFQQNNLGCKQAVSSAIDWFFSQVEEGIILEDDCLPDPTFFSFCTELLYLYRSDRRVMHISGTSFLGQQVIPRMESYYFSGFTPIWGWATWRRAWQYYCVDPMPNLQNLKLDSPYFNRRTRWFIQEVQAGRLDTWDVQWLVTVRSQGGLSIIPKVSMIENIGFGLEATHTIIKPAWMQHIVVGSISNLVHPGTIEINSEADWHESKHIHQQKWYMKLIEAVYFPLKSWLATFRRTNEHK